MWVSAFEGGVSVSTDLKLIGRPPRALVREVFTVEDCMAALGFEVEEIISIPAGEGVVKVHAAVEDEGAFYPCSSRAFRFLLHVDFTVAREYLVIVHEWFDVLDWIAKYLPTLRLLRERPQFVSIAAVNDVDSSNQLYACDAAGGVWCRSALQTTWRQLSDETFSLEDALEAAVRRSKEDAAARTRKKETP
jgi:hypothetical protein